jgi:hypothetical protein
MSSSTSRYRERWRRQATGKRALVARSVRARGVEFATFRVGGLVQSRRLLEPTGYLPPAEYEAHYSEQAAVA